MIKARRLSWSILQGESPCRERPSQSPVSSVAFVAEPVEIPGTKQMKRIYTNYFF